MSRFGFQSPDIPGSCNEYNIQTGQCSSVRGMMKQFRNGASTLNVSSYFMSMGGYDPFGRQHSSVEVFDPRQPQIGWHEVPK